MQTFAEKLRQRMQETRAERPITFSPNLTLWRSSEAKLEIIEMGPGWVKTKVIECNQKDLVGREMTIYATDMIIARWKDRERYNDLIQVGGVFTLEKQRNGGQTTHGRDVVNIIHFEPAGGDNG